MEIPAASGGLGGVAPAARRGAELLGRERLEHRVGVLGHPLGELVGGPLVDPLELVEEREFLLLLLGVLGDLLALALDVGRGNLGLGALGEERAGRHRQGGGDRAGESGGQHGAGPAVAPETPATMPNTAASPSLAP